MRPSARIAELHEPAWLHVTQEDAARGWVDAPRATRLTVDTNGAHGYWLELAGTTAARVVAVEVRGIGPTETVALPGRLRRPATGPVRERLELGWRLHLAEGTRPGVYAWPLRLAARPARRR